MKRLRTIKMPFTIIILAVVMAASTAYGQTYLGADNNITCKMYLDTIDADPDIARAYNQWAFGYVSGLNASNFHTNKVDLLDTHTKSDLLVIIKAFCLGDESALKKSLKEAVDYFWGTLSNPKQQDAE
jgi:hypothetical protein